MCPALDKKFKHDIDVVVDRIVVRGDPRVAARGQLRDGTWNWRTASRSWSLRTSRRLQMRPILRDAPLALLRMRLRPLLTLRRGLAPSRRVRVAKAWMARSSRAMTKRGRRSRQDRRSPSASPSRSASPVRCRVSPSPRSSRGCFLQHPFGACPECDGLGTELKFDAALVVPDNASRCEKARSRPGRADTSPYYMQTLEALCTHLDVSTGHVVDEAHEERAAMPSCSARAANRSIHLRRRHPQLQIAQGLRGRDYQYGAALGEGRQPMGREELGRYQSDAPCEECHGLRLKPEALAVKIAAVHWRSGSVFDQGREDWLGRCR